jgi:hypothetical protein
MITRQIRNCKTSPFHRSNSCNNSKSKTPFCNSLTKYCDLIGSKVEIAQIKSKNRNECSIQNSNNPNSNVKSGDTIMHRMKQNKKIKLGFELKSKIPYKEFFTSTLL